MELWQMSAVELARTIRLGQASSREAVQSVTRVPSPGRCVMSRTAASHSGVNANVDAKR